MDKQKNQVRLALNIDDKHWAALVAAYNDDLASDLESADDMDWITKQIAVGGAIWSDRHMASVARQGVTHILNMNGSDDTLLAKPYAQDLRARWLLNVAEMTVGDYPTNVPPQWLIPPRVFQSDFELKRFPDVAADLGLDVEGLAGGCIVEDFDGDERRFTA